MRLVIIEWEDSRQPCGAWIWQDEVEVESVKCQSVGWLITDNEDIKVLAPNRGDVSCERSQVSGVFTIPTRCVIKIHDVRHGKLIYK